MLLTRALLRVVFQVAFFGAVLFLPIGTWQWPRALWLLATLGFLSLSSTLILFRVAPASLEARVSREAMGDRAPGDRMATFFLLLFTLAWMIFLVNDGHHWQILPAPPPGIPVFGAAFLVQGYVTMLAAVMENRFAAPVVGDQSHRGQVVIDTGPYEHIRHPLYLGYLIFLAGMGLWLGSYASVLLLPVVFSPVAARILLEEKELRERLPGYVSYASRVRYRLIPYLW